MDRFLDFQLAYSRIPICRATVREYVTTLFLFDLDMNDKSD
jgi:hypothetical protein